MTTARRVSRWMTTLAAIAAGCGGDLSPPPCEDGSCETQTSSRTTYHATYSRKVDILFVIDDTSAMAPHASALAAGLAGMGQALQEAAPRLSSIHVGVIRAGSCDAGTRGSACGVTTPESFLRSEWCQTISNFSGALADAVACLGDLGASNCAPAQPLAAALQLLGGPPPAGWEGFMRPDAYLLIVAIAAQDDASGPPGSLSPARTLADAAKALKPDPSQVLVSIVGPGDCAAGDAPGARLTEFVSEFGSFGRYKPLCEGQWPAALDPVTTFTNSAHIPACLRNVRDTDPDAPRLQADCTVEDIVTAPDGSLTSARLPSCDLSSPPCWRLAGVGACGATAASRIVQIERATDWCVDAGENFTIECLGCADANDPACAVQP